MIDFSKHKTSMMVLIALLWIVIMILGWANYYVEGMVLGVVLMLLHAVLGSSHNDKISKKFFVYPLLSWAALWIVSFILSQVYAVKFAGVMPNFTVLGLHPSFAPTFFLYWIGGMLTLSLGFYVLRNEWLSDETWETFLNEVKQLKEE